VTAELPYVRVYIGFANQSVGAVFTVGHPTLGRVGVTPVGADDAWVEVTQWVRSWSFRRGAGKGDDPTLRYDAGTASIVLNDGDRRFDPDNLVGPYAVAGRSQVEPMRRVKIVATWAGVDYPLFYGYADDFKPDYDGNFWTTTTLTVTDASKVFANVDRNAIAPVGAGEDSGARIARLLDSVGWPAGDRLIATGNTTLQATDLSGNLLGELQLVQDSEGGEFYLNAQGWAVFRNRKAMITAARSTTSQALFGDDPAGYAVSGELPYADVKPSTGDDTMVNRVSVSCVGGTEQIVEDTLSESRYLTKSHTRNDLLMQTDAEALAWGKSILYQYAQPPRRHARVEFNRPRPDVEAVLWPVLLGREFGDRITIRTRPAGGGAVIQKDSFIRGVEMSGDSVMHSTAFVLQGADRYSFFVVGDPILGRVGLNAISY
jgi:hypothetical protein